MTIIPLVLFAIALNHTSLGVVTGLAQYRAAFTVLTCHYDIYGEHTLITRNCSAFVQYGSGCFLCISENLYSHYLRARLKPVFGGAALLSLTRAQGPDTRLRDALRPSFYSCRAALAA